MKKPDSLRAAIVAAMPALDQDPDRFLVFVKTGKLVSRWGADPSFEYRYTLVIGLLDFPGDPNLLFLSIQQWLQVNQADILVPGRDDDAFDFAADILDSGKADIRVEIPLTESVIVTIGEDGQPSFDYLAEPTMADFGLAPLGGPLTELDLGAERLIP